MNDKELRRSSRLLSKCVNKSTADNVVNEAMSGESVESVESVESGDKPNPMCSQTYAHKSNTSPKKGFRCEKCAQLSKDLSRKSVKCYGKAKTCFDSESNKLLKVCDSCAKLMAKSDNKLVVKKAVANDEKQKYVSNCRSFALSLVQLFGDNEAQRLYCPNYKHYKPCACLQRYVIGNGLNVEESHKRAKNLLNLLKRAKNLSQQKCYGLNGKVEKVGLGNGQKKSKEFEKFVITNRNFLRKELQFCERAAQKVLFYSNNFLHKKLKTEPNNRRIERQKGKAATGRLIDISLLNKQICCRQKCVQMASTYPNLIESWRQRASISQSDARRVLSEMLTPTQGVRINCYKFVSLVTGSSFRTINSVNEFMRYNGGVREPKQHGLKQFWRQNKKTLPQSNDHHKHNNNICINNTHDRNISNDDNCNVVINNINDNEDQQLKA